MTNQADTILRDVQDDESDLQDVQDSQPNLQDQQISEPEPLPPEIHLTVSGNRMELELLLLKSGENTRNPVFEELMEAIAGESVTYGINEVALRSLCETPLYNRRMIIANGLPPKTGEDGFLTYLVEQKRELRPKMRENGTVDYRDLGFIQNVEKGQVLCEIHPPQQGEAGSDVYGNLLEGIWGKEAKSPQGKNTVLSEDGTQLLAECDGSADVQKGIINVLDTLRVNGNIDNSTGDITFTGDLTVTGDVLSGFRVKVEGNVMIMGSVEGAHIEATGDIVVGEGINGMNRGSVVAGGNLKSKYIQSCFIRTQGDIYANAIMYCSLECSGNVELSGGKRATLIGGRSSIAGVLSAQTIGTDSHIATYITMASSGMDKNQEILELDQEMKRLDDDNMKLLQVMARYDDLKKKKRLDNDSVQMVIQVKQQYLSQVKRMRDLKERQEDIKREQLEASRENSYIKCKGRIHSGVQITFGPLMMNVQQSFVGSRVSIIGEEITISPL